MAANQKKNPTTYTYVSVDGSKSTIQVGQDGVTKQWLAFLMTDDAAVLEQEDRQRKHADYSFRNAVARYAKDPDREDIEHPIEQIPDPVADIFRILYPEDTEDSPLLVKLRETIGQLTDDQRDLIFDLYGMCKTYTQVGKEKNVTEAAIRCRRDKIHKRLKKLIES